MPKSKVRKNRKKASHKPILSKRAANKANNSKEVYEKDGLRLTRDGKNVFLKNTRTQKEHELFLNKLKENRPGSYSAISDSVDEAVSLFSKYDKIKLLGGIAYNQFVQQNNPEDDGLSEVTLEYALSIAYANGGNSHLEPAPEIINQLIALLVDIRAKYNLYMMTEHVEGKYSDLEGQMRYKTIVDMLYGRGDAYRVHVNEVFSEMFLGHDEVLVKKFGFNSADVYEAVQQYENSFASRIAFPNGANPFIHRRFVDWGNKKLAEGFGQDMIQDFGDENADVIVENGKISLLRIDDISVYPELFKIRFRNEKHRLVAEEISCSLGDNLDFLNPKYKGLPVNDSIIFTKPIVKIDEDYYHFAFSLPVRRVFEIVESLIKEADPAYYKSKFLGNKYSESRDNYLEKKAKALFEKIIPGADVYFNSKYRPGVLDKAGNLIETELDLLILSQNATYVIEMKAGGLTAPARRGAIKSLTSGLKETVGYGAYQSFRATKYILESEFPEFHESGRKVVVDKAKPVYRITVTLEHLAGLIASLYDLKELNVIDSSVGFAWTISLFDLIIFSEIIDGEKDLLDYLSKRYALYSRPEMYFQDEIDLLGYFLDKGLEFDEKLIADLDMFQLNRYSDDIDNYFERGGAKPKRKRISQ